MTSPEIPRAKVVRHHTDIVTKSARRKFDSDIIIEEDYDVRDPAQARKAVKKTILVTRHNTEVLRKRPPEIDISPSRLSDEVKVTRRSLSRHGSRVQQSSRAQVLDEAQTSTATVIKSLGATKNKALNERREQLEELSAHQLKRHGNSVTRVSKITPGLELALFKLQHCRCVLLTGSLGSGKTFTALNLVREILDSHEDHVPVFLQSPDDVQVVKDTPKAMVVLADDFLGNVFYNPACIAHWNRASSHMTSLLERKRIFLILTCERDSIDFVQSEPFFEIIKNGFVIDLNSDDCKLSKTHTNAMMSLHGINGKQLSNVGNALTDNGENRQFGFPLACRIYSARKENDSIKQKPQEFLIVSLEKLRKHEFLHYFVLVLTMLCGDQLILPDMPCGQRTILDQLSRLYRIEISSLDDMLTVARQLIDRYLTFDEGTNCFEFLHKSFYYAAMYTFIQEHKEYAIELVPVEETAVAYGCKKLSSRLWDLIGQCVSPELTQNELNLVLARYKTQVESQKSDSHRAVAASVMWRNEVFVDLSLAILGVDFFITMDVENKPFTVHLIRNGHVEATTKVLAFIVQFRGENNEDILSQLQATLEEMCQEPTTSSLEVILPHLPPKACIDNSLMCAAARSGSVETVKLLLGHGGHLTKSDIFEAACASSQPDMLHFLFSQLDADSQYTVLRRRDGEGKLLVHYAAMAMTPRLLEFLNQHGGDPLALSKDGRSVLHIASCHGRLDVVKHICSSYSSLAQQTDNNGFTAAHLAALEGHADLVEYLLSQGTNPALLVTGRNTILHLAAYNGRPEVIRKLCRQYPELVMLKNAESYTAAQLAAISGHLDSLKVFLSLYVDPFLKTVDGRTFLHLAAFHGRLNTVQYLCVQYPDIVCIPDNDGNTAGHDAAASGMVPVLEYLIKSGIDPELRSLEGCTLLHDACYYGRMSMVEYLCDNHPGIVDIGTISGYTASHGAALGGFVQVFDVLVKKGADPYALSVDASTMLHEAAYSGHLKMVQYLYNKYQGMSSRRNKRSYLPVHFAAQEGQLEVLQYLISVTGDSSSTTEEQQTFLHIASYNGRLDVVRHLCRSYKDMVRLVDCNGASAIHYAARGGHTDVLTYLMALPFDPLSRTNNESTILHLAAYDGKLDVVRYICRRYPQLTHAVDKFRHNAIHYAAGSTSLELLKYLLGLDIDPKLRTDNGGTLLLKAAYNGRLDNVQYICQTYPYLIPEVDVYGCSVAHYAVCCGRIDVLKYVTGLDTDLLSKTSDGHTLLHIAAFHGRLDTVRYLYDRYPEMRRATDNMGNTPEMYAKLGEQKEVARFLETRQKLSGPAQVGEESTPCVCCCSGKTLRSCMARLASAVCFCRRE